MGWKDPDYARAYYREWMRKRRADPVHGAKLREYKREYEQRPGNKERIAARKREYMREYYRRPEIRARYRANKRLALYNWPPERVAEYLERQGGKCAICLRPFIPENEPRTDHCHATGVPRGLLDSRCNTAIGLMGDDPDALRRAAAYIEEYR